MLRAALLCILPICALAADGLHQTTYEGVVVRHAWAPAGALFVYLEVENRREGTVMLHQATTKRSASIKLTGAALKATGGPVPIPEFPIPAGTKVDFISQSQFLTMDGLDPPLKEGEIFVISLDFAPIGPIAIPVEVLSADTLVHPHAGHTH